MIRILLLICVFMAAAVAVDPISFWRITPSGAAANTAPVPKTGAAFLSGYTLDAREDGTLRPGVAWPSPRFTDNNDGTVKDNLSGLIWLKNANQFTTRTWAQALTDCSSVASGTTPGLTDGSTAGQWRLPNRNELLTLIDYGRFVPALPMGHPFLSVQLSSYWSGTSYASGTSGAWIVNLRGGAVRAYDKTSAYYVWPVRGGS